MTNTTKRTKRGIGFWVLQGPGWIVLSMLIYAQGISAFSYGLGVSMGTQKPAERITEVGTAFSYGLTQCLTLYLDPDLQFDELEKPIRLRHPSSEGA